jgi:renalase
MPSCAAGGLPSTLQKPLGQSHLWDAATGLGAGGDWCLGHRLEDAFISGLELALAAL